MMLSQRPGLRAKRLLIVSALALSGALAAGSASQAQSPLPRAVPQEPQARPDATKPDATRPDSSRADPSKAEATAPRARPPRDRRTQLNALFEGLRLAPDEESAKALSSRLDAMFAQSGSASADLLMARAELAAEAKQYDLAVELLDSVIEVAPDSLAARARRATINYMRDDYSEALVDISEVLAREPRHYTALLGLALIMRELGDEKRALDAARKALAVYPRLDAAKEIETELKVGVEGREI